MADLPVGSGGLARRKKIDEIVDKAVTGASKKEKAKPAYARKPTPERNDSYSSMEERIYGEQSATRKGKK